MWSEFVRSLESVKISLNRSEPVGIGRKFVGIGQNWTESGGCGRRDGIGQKWTESDGIGWSQSVEIWSEFVGRSNRSESVGRSESIEIGRNLL